MKEPSFTVIVYIISEHYKLRVVFKRSLPGGKIVYEEQRNKVLYPTGQI